jgi:hypothetical protein
MKSERYFVKDLLRPEWHAGLPLAPGCFAYVRRLASNYTEVEFILRALFWL